jgi:hypothetical protein
MTEHAPTQTTTLPARVMMTNAQMMYAAEEAARTKTTSHNARETAHNAYQELARKTALTMQITTGTFHAYEQKSN